MVALTICADAPGALDGAGSAEAFAAEDGALGAGRVAPHAAAAAGIASRSSDVRAMVGSARELESLSRPDYLCFPLAGEPESAAPASPGAAPPSAAGAEALGTGMGAGAGGVVTAGTGSGGGNA